MTAFTLRGATPVEGKNANESSFDSPSGDILVNDRASNVTTAMTIGKTIQENRC